MNSRALVPAVYGGLIMAVISATPFLNLLNCCCGAGLLFGGFIAVYFYKSTFTPDMPPFTAGDCMQVGALAGIVGAIGASLLALVFMAVFGNVMGEIVRMLQEHGDLPEDVVDHLQQILEGRAPGVVLIAMSVLRLMFYPVFGLLGGLIGYSMFRPSGGRPPAGPTGAAPGAPQGAGSTGGAVPV